MSAPLYNAEILRLAATIPHHARLTDPMASVEKRSAICGSRVTVDVALDDATPRSRASESGDGEIALPVNAAWLENENIDRALRITGGNRARAAAILGLDRSTLFRKRPPE